MVPIHRLIPDLYDEEDDGDTFWIFEKVTIVIVWQTAIGHHIVCGPNILFKVGTKTTELETKIQKAILIFLS